ncbi:MULTISPECIES: translation initiation factor 2 [Lysinibacillus]|uniref:Translation initiation factor 2 n=1 Tax=Lysinibacillus sphaericus CBAM5 TaxID=1400869 RepID=W7S1W4_LYSSH|nr:MULTISPECIES: translation initiation factor 2 [Lysinibacillus]EWH32211.1 translation initiation factor 2 [Lysinibacillus sphaericus CBAM5]MDR0158832.1 translation initiation factor 2 [Lysinibacillus sphaericus]
MYNYRNNSEQNLESEEISIARLAYIGAAIATFGDGLTTVAAGLALHALETTKSQNLNNVRQKEVDDLQKQLDNLISELNKIKKMML